MFAHTLGVPLGLGYLAAGERPLDAGWISGGHYEVEVAGERIPAQVSLRPFYDPAGERVKC